ncbi:hypothetical protein F2Q70_00002863 [Brassica cretica]|uniref:Uncharacterized protein n=1 Tax=Brassica cretica TaxID=69181 RepID=A0A8S9IJI6_BRACR|nr:hypothetical protein F2Q70_00002863 [Brassica cretica]
MGSNQTSHGLRKNPRVPIRPQGSKDKKKLEPICSLGRIGVITTSKNLRVPQNDLRIQTSGLGRIGIITSLKDLRVPMRPQGPSTPGSRYDLGSKEQPSSLIRPPGPITENSGFQSNQGPPGPKHDLRIRREPLLLLHNLRVPRLPYDRSIVFRTKTTPMPWLDLKQASKSLDKKKATAGPLIEEIIKATKD